MRLVGLGVVAFVVACGSSSSSPSDASSNEGAPNDAFDDVGTDGNLPLDGAMDSAETSSDAMMGSASPLLLSEVALAPDNSELVEIVNTSSQTIDLTTYYLSDSGLYFKLPAGNPSLDAGDFIAKFPQGAMIPGHSAITIAVSTTANFTTAYGTPPTYSIASGTMSVVASNGAPSLTNAGEVLVLFRWDGSADLVQDADILLAGAPVAMNKLVDKSGAAQDGPDMGSQTSTYASDANTIPSQSSAPGANVSTKRITVETGHETHNGTGNGIAGEDETSEDTSMTWDTTFTAPTPGQAPQALFQ